MEAILRLCNFEWKRPVPVRRRLSLSLAYSEKHVSGSKVLTSAIKASLDKLFYHSIFSLWTSLGVLRSVQSDQDRPAVLVDQAQIDVSIRDTGVFS